MKPIYYQIKLLGTPFGVNKLKSKLAPYNSISIVDGTINEAYPILYLYYAQNKEDKVCDFSNLEELAQNLQVLPIVKKLNDCRNYLPPCLSGINAVELNDSANADIDKLLNYILNYFGYKGFCGNRKVFISYKRDDCVGLAQELFVKLSAANFIPFLDSYTIEPGVNFQDNLKHELADSEIMIFINSPHYEDSDWCKEELNVANATQVGIVQLTFDTSKKFAEAVFSKVVEMGSFNNDMKTTYDNKLQEIVDTVESFRAESFERKKKNLIKRFLNEHKESLPHVIDDNLYVSSNKKEAFYLMTRFPASTDLQNIEKKIDSCFPKLLDKEVVYDDSYCRLDVKQHYEWLNNANLPVKIHIK